MHFRNSLNGGLVMRNRAIALATLFFASLMAIAQSIPAGAAQGLTWVIKQAPPYSGPMVGDGHGNLYAFAFGNGSALMAFKYSASTNKWSRRASDPEYGSGYLPNISGESATLTTDGRIIVFGGDDANNTDLSSVAAYNPTTNTWQNLAPLPIARYDAAAVTGPAGKIYAIGGDYGGSSGGEGEVTLTSVEAYSPTKNSWQELSPLKVEREFAAGAAGSNGLIYVFGGCNQGYENEGDCSQSDTAEVLNPASTANTWSILPLMPADYPSCAFGCGTSGGAGVTSGLIYLNGVGAYNPVTGTWTPFSTSPASPLLVAPGGSKCGYLYGLGFYTYSSSLEMDRAATRPGKGC